MGTPTLVCRRATETITLLHSVFGPSFRGVCIGSTSVCRGVHSCIDLVTPKQRRVIRQCANRLPVFSGFTVAGRVGSLFKHAIACGDKTCLVVRRARTVRIVSMGDKGHSGNDSTRRGATVSIGATTTSRVTHRLHLHSVNNVVMISFVSVTRTTGQRGLFRRVAGTVTGSQTGRGVLPLDGFNLVRVAHRHIHPTVSISASRTYPAYFNANAVGPSVLFASDLRKGVSYLIGGRGIGGFTLRMRPCITTFVGDKGFPLD